MALAVIVLALAGVGPLGSKGGGVGAQTDCRYVTVREPVKVPELVRRRDGQQVIVIRERLEKRQVRRCGVRR